MPSAFCGLMYNFRVCSSVVFPSDFSGLPRFILA